MAKFEEGPLNWGFKFRLCGYRLPSRNYISLFEIIHKLSIGINVDDLE